MYGVVGFFFTVILVGDRFIVLFEIVRLIKDNWTSLESYQMSLRLRFLERTKTLTLEINLINVKLTCNHSSKTIIWMQIRLIFR